MLKNISEKVRNMPRVIEQPQPNVDENEEDENSKPILIVSGYGTDDKLIKTLKSHENEILRTESFKNASKPLFQFVNKTGPNVGSRLSVLKSLALKNKVGNTVPCNNHGNCQCCAMIGTNVDEVNGQPVVAAPGNCKSKNVTYLVTCRLCHKPYIGRTVQFTCTRMSGHRECYYKVLRNEEVDLQSDEYSLGLHLVYGHGRKERGDFNRIFNVQVLENCNPSTLEKKEHCYIHKYNTLVPIGLNKMNPFGLPVLR
jgi:hypothetical protein